LVNKLLQHWRDWRAREAHYKQKCVEGLEQLGRMNRNIAANQAETARLRAETEVIMMKIEAAWQKMEARRG
jgi:branched-subunit amino acid aminotransferase/4-amino-4-deoxychorismate lyase